MRPTTAQPIIDSVPGIPRSGSAPQQPVTSSAAGLSVLRRRFGGAR